ncbi:L-glutamate gamma-semialdehyde dehydrogenase [Nocardiopsis sp. NRRL B-16309]|uniref:L-glutamate gamma-semialdehyde dehydrogenase n=1 Tax=Nocardiopsis sp. NRRL B-16309 TaxID=1519494 RepID=UPI0006AF1722|nr:L-glutamate gamma-semialdehyde dehydrogenase [Nocardiopsis sp. NRRL B-16309]KOX18323.1 1-pyrroline-5-carboxylate dehydrogenase [Nocardiopsis sp. NRRL B-16309]
MDAVTNVPQPKNEPVLTYAPGSAERAELVAKLEELGSQSIDLPMHINGESRMGGGERIDVVQPHRHAAVLGTMANATHDDARDAIAAAKAAAPAWRAMSFDDRAAIILRAAELLAGPWRATINAATMLGQSKTVQQAEIDAACELIDFWRFNVSYARTLIEQQPLSVPGVWNRMEQRPLEGFVYAITPFNFTAIAGNLPTAPALMGNVVVWKPSPTQQFAAELTMRLLEEAGMPAGVINMVTGDGLAVSDVALNDPDLAGVHFTGSTRTFQHLWKSVGENISHYRSYPRIVGETGGKDFIVAHKSADPEILRTAIVRGAFEYQGQKCSAASRAFVARSVWEKMRDDLVAETEAIKMGDVTDLSNFVGAVIDRRSFDKLAKVLEDAKSDPTLSIVAGGTADDSVGYFVRPTIIEGTDPTHDVFRTEYFGPIVAVHVYEDEKFDEVLDIVDQGSAYALTGAILANDRAAVAKATEALRFTAGNFYINDRPTGSIVGQQPFGGGRASGTNDKAGSAQNLSRWASPRAIKETFVAPTNSAYPHMG